MLKYRLRHLSVATCIGCLIFAFAAPCSAAETAGAEAKKADPLDGLKCFIMKKKAVKGKQVVAYKGGKLHLCCSQCVRRFKKTPAKYEAKANHQMVLTGQFLQHACPVTGQVLPKDAPSLKIGGVKTKFASQQELAKVKKMSEEDQIATIFGVKGFKTGKFEIVKKKEKRRDT